MIHETVMCTSAHLNSLYIVQINSNDKRFQYDKVKHFFFINRHTIYSIFFDVSGHFGILQLLLYQHYCSQEYFPKKDNLRPPEDPVHFFKILSFLQQKQSSLPLNLSGLASDATVEHRSDYFPGQVVKRTHFGLTLGPATVLR